MEANWHVSLSPGNIFLDKGQNRIGSRYKKVVYREYTDESFKVQKKRQPDQQHLGIIGKLSWSFCRRFFLSFFYQEKTEEGSGVSSCPL